MKKFTFRRLGCCALLLAFTAGVQAEVKVSLEEPVWEFSYRAGKSDAHRNRVNRDEGEFFHNVQPLLQKQDFKGVEQAWNTYRQEHEKVSAMLHEMMGQVFLSLKKNSEAKKHFELALKEDPSSSTSHRGLSMIYMLDEAYEKAREHVVASLALGV